VGGATTDRQKLIQGIDLIAPDSGAGLTPRRSQRSVDKDKSDHPC
jgi:hypothetical protein